MLLRYYYIKGLQFIFFFGEFIIYMYNIYIFEIIVYLKINVLFYVLRLRRNYVVKLGLYYDLL